MNRVISAFLVVILVCVFSGQGEAKVYKWKDENGKWHFTDDVRKVPKAPRSLSHPTTSKKPSVQSDPEKKSSIENKHSNPSSGKSFEAEEGFQQMGDALAKGLEKGIEKLGEEMGKAFGGFGELLAIAEQNQPDNEKRVFKNKEDELRHDTQQVLLGMFLACQFQFIVGKSEACSKNFENSDKGWKVDKGSEMSKKFEDYIIDIDPNKNTRQNLLIKAHHKDFREVWEITQEGKSSLKKSSMQTESAES